jgi:hypothetical protein
MEVLGRRTAEGAIAMNCDQVFAILTRGPFPSGDATDHVVESHLACCPECRNFADALRPDGSTDSETLVPEESRGLPYYWGLAATPGSEGLVSTALSSKRSQTRRRQKSLFKRSEPLAHLSGWQLAFAVLMGAALGTVLRVLGYAEDTQQAPMASSSVPAMRSPDSSRSMSPQIYRQLVSKLGVMPECVEQRYSPAFASDGSDDDQPLTTQTISSSHCCTECHNGASPRLSLSGSTARIVRSCQVCHSDVTANLYRHQ